MHTPPQVRKSRCLLLNGLPRRLVLQIVYNSVWIDVKVIRAATGRVMNEARIKIGVGSWQRHKVFIGAKSIGTAVRFEDVTLRSNNS